jgi:tagatose 6-phosphate kinase
MKILTITLNPAVDTRYEIDNVMVGEVNRVINKVESPGGKGLNVSNVLNKLGANVIATGFLGGTKGEFIKKKLEEKEIYQDFQCVLGETRTCMAIIDNDKKITEILESGNPVSSNEKEEFLEKYSKLLEKVEIVDMSGSLPKGVPSTFYKELIEIANKMNKKVILDTSGEALKEGIKANPYLIKPNVDEMEFLLGKKIENIDEVIKNAKEIQKNGVSNVMVTLGGDGGLLITKDSVYQGTFPKVNIENTVGSGDSSVAGFIYGLSKNMSLEESFKYALACGTSNAMLKNTGDIDLDTVSRLLTQIEVQKI